MYYQELPSGKYRFFESYTDPQTLIRKTTSVTMDKNTTKSRKAAQDALRARIEALTAEANTTPHITLPALLEAYAKAKEQIVRPQTLTRNLRTLRKTIEMFPNGILAESLNARLVSEAFSSWDVPNMTKNERLRRLKAFLRWAYKLDYIPDVSWLDKLPLYPDNRKGRREFKYLERDELDAVIAAAEPEYGSLIAFMALSGLRVGEAIALTPEDITDVISVNKTFSAVTGEIGPTKTDGSTREVYIQRELEDVLRNAYSSDRHVFTKNGRQIQYYTFNKYFRNLTKRTIGRPLTTHALRHTHTSLLAAAGVPLDVVSRRLGHADSKVTRDIYFHVTQEMKDRDKAILDGLRLL